MPTYCCAIPPDHRRLIGATPAALVEVGELDLLAAALGREVRRGGGQPPRLQHRDVHRVQPRHRLEGSVPLRGGEGDVSSRGIKRRREGATGQRAGWGSGRGRGPVDE